MGCQSQRCSSSQGKEPYKIYSFPCLFLFLLILTPSIGNAASTNASDYQAVAYRTFGSIEIDGDFNEPDWQEAKPVGQFSQVEPGSG